MKKKIIKISLVVTGVLFSVSTVYAASDAYQNFIDWANQEKNKAQQQLKTNLEVSVEKEIALLNEKTNHLISESNKEIANMGMTEKEDTKNAINQTLANHQHNLELSASEISKNSGDDFTEIAKKVNVHSKSILDTIESSYHDEMSKLTYNTVDKASVENDYLKSAENLNKEIELTQESINQLKEVQAVEENQHVKDYIQRKIDLLEQLIVLLQMG
jgi:hypothetical protein